ncbi:MAG: ornithine/acetylornithine aminotransferase [Bacteriovoracaceae bacterium]|nr:ornithine/acetylornithine aminotransferase [Bacteriovoracaceae bacterium]
MHNNDAAKAIRRDAESFSIRSILENQSSRFENHLNYMNPQMPKVLKTLGFDKTYIRAEGAYLWDQDENRYLDFLSGYGVFNLGRYHPVIVQAMRDMLDYKDASLVQFDCPHLLGELAKALVEKVPHLERVYFTSTGAETVETAIKFAKAHTKRDRILFFDHGFHGLTNGALSVNGNKEFREGFGKLLPDCNQIPFNDLNALEKELKKKDVAAFIFEPIQGKGVFIPSPGFLKAAEELCHKYGALTIADEVQSGMGRTGKFLACEHENVHPDIVLLSKSLSGGIVPTGAVLSRTEIFKSVFSRMDRCVVHSSSFGKNSFSAAMGLATLWVIDHENILERAAQAGESLMTKLNALKKKFELLGEIRGRGCMIGIEFQSPKSLQLKMGWSLLHTLSKDLFPQLITVPLMRDHRILTQTSGHHQDIVKILPPLIIEEEDIQYFVSSFEKVLEGAHKFPGGIWDLGKSLAKTALGDSKS